MIKRMRIHFQGTVQGVGFRPHIFRLAQAFGLAGWVSNDAAGVIVEIQGETEKVKQFLKAAVEQAPVLARIKSFSESEIPIAEERDFLIRKSSKSDAVSTQVSADAATCKDCLAEMFDPRDRRNRYPFINCTNCGPRFTIIERIPYDRPFTTMKTFKMCPDCQREYDDPANRRFHAQPNACPVCGPRLILIDRDSSSVPGDPVSEAIKLMHSGKIIAIKSLGGFQLACDALNQSAVSLLRSRKIREDKPFAVMAPDVETIKKYGQVSVAESELLESPERPIVLLQKKEGSQLADGIAPGQKNYGFMLPYTPVHHLLMAEGRMLLVMTSGNLSDEPIAFQDQEAMDRLKNIADYFLTNNRPIHIRCDDSVMRVFEDKTYPLRRARGYVPRPLELQFPEKRALLATGAHLKNTFALAQAGQVIVSQHIGDLDNLETLTAFEQGIEHFKNIFEIEPLMVVHDLHPDYLSTVYAQKLGIPKLAVQHHHAHAASVMAEHNLKGPVIGVSLDGTGYGSDGAIWGGEFLLADYDGFERKAHLGYIPMPGGERAIKEPWRMALSWLHKIFGDDLWKLDLPFLEKLDRRQCDTILAATKKGINAPLTSSMGRLFDAMSSLIGQRQNANYEGQPAIELEMIADGSESGHYPFNYRQVDAKLIIEPASLIQETVADLKKRESPGKISARFHNGVANMVSETCARIKKETGIKVVTLGGGVFQNFWILSRSKSLLEEKGFEVFVHRQVPANDGGISLGQAAIGLWRMKDVLGSPA
jgi:hydrogenase maturation protein HypF